MLNNLVELTGRVVSLPKFSHSCHSISFFKMEIECHRMSQNSDIIPIIVSEHVLEDVIFEVNDRVAITGTFSSHNEGKTLQLFVLANAIDRVYLEKENDQNNISLIGYICKPPIIRETPKGKIITDLFLAVNKTYNRSDYIPCIAWGTIAAYANSFNVGDKIRIKGRIQSREYSKTLENGETILKTAYEVSIFTTHYVDDSI